MSDAIKAEMVALTPRMRRFAYALTGSRDDGDDLVQAACVKALTRLDQFTAGTRLDAWMFTIIRTGWLDRLRAQKRRGTVADPEMIDRLSDDGLGARRAEGRLTLERVRALMATLPEEQRTALALVAVDGRSYQDAAAVLGVPVGTVMSRLARARARLVTRLREVRA